MEDRMNKVVETRAEDAGNVGFYMDFFGFRERPFTLVPDPDFLFWSAQHRRAYSVLEFGILSRAPITLVTGGVGCGKTTLWRELLRQFRRQTDGARGVVSHHAIFDADGYLGRSLVHKTPLAL